MAFNPEFSSPKIKIALFGEHYYNIETGVKIISLELTRFIESIYNNRTWNSSYELSYDMHTRHQSYTVREPIRIHSLLQPAVMSMVMRSSIQAITPIVVNRMFRPSDFNLSIPTLVRLMPKSDYWWPVYCDGMVARSKIFKRLVIPVDGTPLEDIVGDFLLCFNDKGMLINEVRHHRGSRPVLNPNNGVRPPC